MSDKRKCWAVKIIGSPFDGYREHFAGAGWFDRPIEPQGTAFFGTKKEAMAAVSAVKKRSRWAFRGNWAHLGGTRVYLGAIPVRVTVQISEGWA